MKQTARMITDLLNDADDWLRNGQVSEALSVLESALYAAREEYQSRQGHKFRAIGAHCVAAIEALNASR